MRQHAAGVRGRWRAATPWRTAAAVAGLCLAGIPAACSTSEVGDAQCLAAFRNAEPRAEPPYQVSPLDDAIKVCSDVASWRRAWDAVPGAHLGHEDPVAYLASRCGLEELQPTELCRSLEADG